MPDGRTPSPQPLHALAALVRSKNAGPFWLTIDVMFRDEDGYRRALAAGIADPAVLGPLLRSDPATLRVTAFDAVRAVKVSLPRRHSAGSPRDSDVLGGQHYAALLDLPVP
jgi:hypothetical protein